MAFYPYLPTMKWLFISLLIGSHGVVSAQADVPLPAIQRPVFKADTFHIVAFGAKSEIAALNTVPINQAIKACSAGGGGVVFVSDGLWITGPLEMESNVNLSLAKNALLQFTTDLEQYPLVETGYEGLRQMRRHSPIRAAGKKNIAITGEGIIDGQGDAWRSVKRGKMTASQWKELTSGKKGVLNADGSVWYISGSALRGSHYQDPGEITADKSADFYEDIKDFLRPNLIVLENCDGILLEGVTFQNSGAWNIHPLGSRNIIIRNLTVRNPWYASNGDGLDIESCYNVLVENCTFDVGDDAICIKSGKNEYGRKMAMPTENVWIRNCVVYHAHGGFVVGSEMSGGARNLYVSDCTFIGTDIGLRFKSQRGRGGVVENVFISRIYMSKIKDAAVLFDMYYDAKPSAFMVDGKRVPPPDEAVTAGIETPRFLNFNLDEIHCEGAKQGIFVRGLPEMPIRNIQFNNVHIRADNGIELYNAENITLKNSSIHVPENKTIAYAYNTGKLHLDRITYRPENGLFLHLQGGRSHQVKITGTPVGDADKSLLADHGAAAGEIELKR